MEQSGFEILCPGCSLQGIRDIKDWTLIRFRRDPGYDHLLWTCPTVGCCAEMIGLCDGGNFTRYTAHGVLVAWSVEAPARIRIAIRQRRAGLDAVAQYIPETPKGLRGFERMLRELHGVDEFIYRCGGVSEIILPHRSRKNAS